MTHDERAVRETMDRWMKASSQGDLPTVLELMADDVVFLVAGREPFGKQQFAQMSEAMRDVRLQGRQEIKDLTITGDIAVCISHVAITVTQHDGETFNRAGYTLSIFRRAANGAWVLSRDANLMTSGSAASDGDCPH